MSAKDPDESETGFNDISLEDDDELSQNSQSSQAYKENRVNLEELENFSNDRRHNIDFSPNNEEDNEDLVHNIDNDTSPSSFELVFDSSRQNDLNYEKFHSVPSCLDEYQDFKSAESTPQNTVFRDNEQFDDNYAAHYSKDKYDLEEHDDSHLVPSYDQHPEGNLDNVEEQSEKFNQLEEELSPQTLSQSSPLLDNELQELNVEKTYEEIPLNDSIDADISQHQSEQASEGFSDINIIPEPESKSKHRKKFKSTTKTLESFFHKSSISKSTKSSKSKSNSITSASSPVSKDLVVTTSSTYISSATKRKDKGPCWTNYEIPSKPSRKGPTLGVFYDSLKSSKSYQRTESSKDQKCIVLQTPDSLERYLHPFQVASNYYMNSNYVKYYNTTTNRDDSVMNTYYYINMMTQRKSLLPYYVTKTIFGNIPGMGRVVVCGTQCGKIIIYSFFTLDELMVLDTRSVYDRYLSRDNSIDSENGFDINKALDSTLFEVNCLALINTFENYSTLLAIGNHLGHLLLYQIPKMQLKKLIYPMNFTTMNIKKSPSEIEAENASYDSEEESEDILIDEMELLKIKRHKSVMHIQNEDHILSTDEDVVFITCLGYCSSTGDLWVGYGNGTFAIYSNKFKLKYFYNSNNLSDGANNNIIVDSEKIYSVNNFEYCTYEQIVLVVYGNVKLDIFTFGGTFLSTINSTRLTNSTTPISSVQVSNTPNGSILYIGLMDGSLLVKQILYTTNSNKNTGKENENGDKELLNDLLSNTIEFILLHKLTYKSDDEVNLGAPVTSICPVPSQQLVLLGNASGGLSVISNLVI